VVGEPLWLMGGRLLLGVLLGVAGSVALQSVVAGQFYGAKPLDPVVMSAVALTLAAVGLAKWGSRIAPIPAAFDET